jgi:DNA-binding NtrC family response regulator
VHMPALRDRREDIPDLVAHFLEKHKVATGTPVEEIAPAAMQRLQEHHWPGNIRDLEHSLQEALIRSRGRILGVDLVDRVLGGTGATTDGAGDEAATGDDVFLDYHDARQLTMTRWQREYLLDALERSGNVVNQAARLVGISPTSFRNMMRKLGLERPGSLRDDP